MKDITCAEGCKQQAENKTTMQVSIDILCVWSMCQI